MNWVLQTSFLGDAVLSLPFLAELLDWDKEKSVGWIAAPRNRMIFEIALERGLSQYRSQVQIFEWKKGSLSPLEMWNFRLEALRALPAPERIFCLHRSFRSGLFSWLCGAKERIGFSSGAATFFYTHAVPRVWDTGRSEIEKNLDLLRELGAPLAPWNIQKAPSLLSGGRAKAKHPRVAISLGSPWPTKQWDLDQAVKLVKELVREGVEIRLMGDAAAFVRSEELRRKIPSVLIENLCGKTNLREWVDGIEECHALVSGDSAAVHVACDLNVPVVALFGPTIPEFGFAPWRRNCVALGVELPCRPCHIHGGRSCPLKHHDCMRNLEGLEVKKALLPYLEALS